MRILHVEDHTLFRDAMVLLVKSFDPEAVVFSAATADEALAAVGHYRNLDLIFLDLALPGVGGLRVMPMLMEKAPTVPIAVLSASEDPRKVRSALELGAAGYIPKTTGGEEMRQALDMIMNGDIYLPSSMLSMLSMLNGTRETAAEAEALPATELTHRQFEVLKLLGTGLSNKAVARRLDLTEGTVKLHVSAILRALEARNRTDAVVEAIRRGWLAGD